MSVHNNIRAFREIHQLSQEDMAEKMNMSLNGYAKIERGETKLNLEKLEQIAHIFNIDLIELIQDKSNGSVFFIVNENTDTNANYYNGANSADIEKFQIELKYKDELLAQQQKEIDALKKVIELLENK